MKILRVTAIAIGAWVESGHGLRGWCHRLLESPEVGRSRGGHVTS